METKDVEKTIKLVKSYIAQPSRYELEYGFTQADMNYLISKNVIVILASTHFALLLLLNGLNCSSRLCAVGMTDSR